MKDLIIIGAGGFGREVAWLVERINKVTPAWNILGFIDDNDSIQGTTINGYPVLGRKEEVINYINAFFVCAIGSSRIRKSIVDRIKELYPAIQFATIIDPSVELSRYVTIGEGTIICAHTIITVNISIGNHVIINLDCTIGHDSIVEDFATMYPSVNISGSTTVGLCTELGTGAQMIQGITVGEYSIVGAGAVVIRNIPDCCTAVGSPAKPIKFF